MFPEPPGVPGPPAPTGPPAPAANPSAPTTSIVVRAFTSSPAAPPRLMTSACAARRPSELSFPVKTTTCPASGWRANGSDLDDESVREREVNRVEDEGE